MTQDAFLQQDLKDLQKKVSVAEHLTPVSAATHLKKHGQLLTKQEMDNLYNARKQAMEKTMESWKIGFYDLETSGLNGDTNQILCCSILDGNTGKVTSVRRDRCGDKLGEDRLLTKRIAEELAKYDMIVTFYGQEFDWKMLESRMARFGVGPYGRGRKSNNAARLEPMHIDLWFTAKGLFNLHDGRLDTLARHLGIKTRKTHIDWMTWQRALFNDVKALNYVTDHCDKDVIVLRDCFMRLKDRIKKVWRR